MTFLLPMFLLLFTQVRDTGQRWLSTIVIEVQMCRSQADVSIFQSQPIIMWRQFPRCVLVVQKNITWDSVQKKAITLLHSLIYHCVLCFPVGDNIPWQLGVLAVPFWGFQTFNCFLDSTLNKVSEAGGERHLYVLNLVTECLVSHLSYFITLLSVVLHVTHVRIKL